MKNLIGLICASLLSSCSGYSDSFDCNYPESSTSPVQGISSFQDLEQGLKCAEKCEKPILLWFAGRTAVGVRKMEQSVFTNKRIFDKLNNDFVVVCLYVDDQTKLPQTEIENWIINGQYKRIETIGDKNYKYQIERFQNNSQPMFVILSSDGKEEIDQFGYLPDVNKVDSILRVGLEKIRLMPTKNKAH